MSDCPDYKAWRKTKGCVKSLECCYFIWWTTQCKHPGPNHGHACPWLGYPVTPKQAKEKK